MASYKKKSVVIFIMRILVQGGTHTNAAVRKEFFSVVMAPNSVDNLEIVLGKLVLTMDNALDSSSLSTSV